jgi:putative ABC transport system permease protein
VIPGAVTSGRVSLGVGSRTTLKLDDVTAIARVVPEVAAAAPSSSTNAQVVAGGVNWFTSIQDSTPAWTCRSSSAESAS